MNAIGGAAVDQYRVRKLEVADIMRGYLELLAQLTVVEPVSLTEWQRRYSEIGDHPQYTLLVVEDTSAGRVVAAGTLLIELKFIRGCGSVGHIEDVVVDASCRGLKLGQRVVSALVDAARADGCYKVILDCAESNADFYAKSGFQRKEVQMVQYFGRSGGAAS